MALIVPVSILWLKYCVTISKDIGVWAGGEHGGGARAPPNFYDRAKITAKFGQNIKISEKF